MITTTIVPTHYLIRYGAIPEILAAGWNGSVPLERGTSVVANTPRGLQIAQVLGPAKTAPSPHTSSSDTAEAETTPDQTEIRRLAGSQDLAQVTELRELAGTEFPIWQQRIADWSLQLQLIDLEWSLDRTRLTLYVLNDRGPECTRLALLAAAGGLGTIDVQPVSSTGLTMPEPQTKKSGCGSCGCHE
jgi:cell fate regulator YaaT (PSP1 superfamily)